MQAQSGQQQIYDIEDGQKTKYENGTVEQHEMLFFQRALTARRRYAVLSLPCLKATGQQPLDELRRRLGLEDPLRLPHLKASFRGHRRPWREVLDASIVRKIREIFSWELETLYPDMYEA